MIPAVLPHAVAEQPPGRRGRARLRTSLQARVITTTTLIGLVAMVLLSLYLTTQIRDGLFATRLAEAERESSASIQEAQELFEASPATSINLIADLAGDVVSRLSRPGPGNRAVVLLRQPGAGPWSERATDKTMTAVISPELRAQVESSADQWWQSVTLPSGAPGLVVGSAVTLPSDELGELYFVYDLSPERATLSLTERVLGIGAALMIAVLAFLTYLITRQVVAPVRDAAHVAERLASGLLSERMVVSGQDEIATLASSFNGMAASLQDQIERMGELSAMQRRFVSDVSHELRTPLTTVRMASEMIYAARGDFPPAVARSAELLAIQLDRFEELLADLLEISRFDAGAATLDVEERDLKDVVTRVVGLVSPLADEKGVALRQYVTDLDARADIDARRVERIVRNLLANAIEHADGRPVDIHVESSETAVAVVVRDHGHGMTTEESAHVFDRFWRADSSRARTTGGTGLGLSIAVEDARLHGGALEAWGDVGEGASFRLVLPRRAGLQIGAPPIDLVPANPDTIVRQTHTDPRDPASLPVFDLEPRP